MTIYEAGSVAAARPATMKAVRIHGYGGPEVLQYEDAPIPQPGEGEILVRVQAAGVNPIDYKMRSGAVQAIFPLTFPAILGSDFAGVVVEVGEGVKHITVGEHVYGTAASEKGGAYAQYAIARGGEVGHKPGALTAVEAASVPVVAMTAWQALHQAARIGRGDKVLIHGAAGGVGMYAIQFARQVGCHIVALSTHEHTSLLRELGADTVLDYNSIQFEQHVSGVDVALDTIGGDIRERTWRTLNAGGILVTTTDPPSQDTAKEYNVRAQMFQMQPSGMLLSDIAKQLNTGELRTFVARILPLEHAAEAQQIQQEGHINGKVVLKVAD